MNEHPPAALRFVYRIGLFLLAAYLVVSAWSFYSGNKFLAVAIFLTVTGMVWLLAAIIMEGLKKRSPLRRKIVAVGLCLYMLTAICVNDYTLNQVFAPSSGWYTVALLLIGVNTLLLAYFDELPQGIRATQSFVLGITAWIFLYLVIYLAPLYSLGIMTAFIFGISLSVFAPLALTWYHGRMLRKVLWKNRQCRSAFLLGAGISVVGIAGFCIYFAVVKQKVEERYGQLVAKAVEVNPEMVLAGEVSDGFMIKMVLKAGLVYTTPLSSPRRSLLEEGSFADIFRKRIHDPLVMIAAFFCGESSIPVGDREVIVRLISGEKGSSEPKFIPPVITDTTAARTTWNPPSGHMEQD
ncbi:XrtN system VIT domain protein [Chitinophaga eiseniae]|uniref:XrtN system VIT domain protein n=1 Tax=Chitinophaga eiseniae TaxID=634771 RepID=A0A1T4SW66_9BACT|nr:hypothetical protein [Chitinophaga eiseniae]SKA32386.1 XrtN system VIT domain protein [Chitinophaga eiseniae]